MIKITGEELKKFRDKILEQAFFRLYIFQNHFAENKGRSDVFLFCSVRNFLNKFMPGKSHFVEADTISGKKMTAGCIRLVASTDR